MLHHDMKRNGYRYYKKTMVKKPQAISNFRFVVQCPASLSLQPTKYLLWEILYNLPALADILQYQ